MKNFSKENASAHKQRRKPLPDVDEIFQAISENPAAKSNNSTARMATNDILAPFAKLLSEVQD